MNTPRPLGLFDLTHRYDSHTAQGDPLEQLAEHMPWASFRKPLEKNLRPSKRTKGGRPPFDAILMFKVLVLQALYNLSDDQTEDQIRDRLSFMRFLGLDLHQRIPDAKTIWLFRETLAQAGGVEKLYKQFDTSIWRTTGYKPVEDNSLMRHWSRCPRNGIRGRKMRRSRRGRVRWNGRRSRRSGGRKIRRRAGPKSMGAVTLGTRILSTWI